MGYRYFRSCLNPAQQKAYDILVNAIQNLDDSCNLPKLNKSQLSDVINAIDYDYPEFFYLKYADDYNRPYSYYSYPTHLKYMLHYDIPKEAVKNVTKQIEMIAGKLIAKAKSSGCRSDLAMTAYIHNYITDNIGYTEKSLTPKRNHCILGGLANKECVCEGYAKLFLHFLNKAGIPAIYVCGKTNTERDSYHAWNMILIDGNWYHTDVTWDADARNKGNWEYFMLTEQEIKAKNHFVLMEFPVPKSTKPLALNREARKLR